MPKKLNLPKAQFKPTDYPGVVFLVAADGTRHYYIRYRDPFGKAHFEKAVIPRVQMSAVKADGVRKDRMRGKTLPNREQREERKAVKAAEAARWTFSRLFDAYLEAKGDYPRRSVDAGNFRKHLRDAIGDKEPAALSPFEVDKIRLTLSKRYKPGTVNAVLGFLSRLSSFAVKRRLCPGIPFRVEHVKDGALKTESMSDAQMSAYLKVAGAVESGVVGKALAFELLTGMRLNEVRNLVWAAVDLDNGTIHIRNPKGGRDQFIPLNDAARELIRRLPRDPDNPFVFQGTKGGRIGVSTAQRYGREIAKAAGLPDGFRPNHGLRHAFASHLASSGEVDLYTLQRLLTHKSPIMTQRYAHLRDETLRRAANVMSRIVAAEETA